MNGLGMLQVTNLGDIVSDRVAALGAAAPYAAAGLGLAQGAATGAVIAGLSCWSMRAAGTGALLGVAAGGLLGGASMLMTGMQLAPAAAEPAAGAAGLGDVGNTMKIAGGLTLATGLAAGVWAGYRIMKLRKRGR
jgi:hypothetical protein